MKLYDSEGMYIDFVTLHFLYRWRNGVVLRKAVVFNPTLQQHVYVSHINDTGIKMSEETFLNSFIK